MSQTKYNGKCDHGNDRYPGGSFKSTSAINSSRSKPSCLASPWPPDKHHCIDYLTNNDLDSIDYLFRLLFLLYCVTLRYIYVRRLIKHHHYYYYYGSTFGYGTWGKDNPDSVELALSSCLSVSKNRFQPNPMSAVFWRFSGLCHNGARSRQACGVHWSRIEMRRN